MSFNLTTPEQSSINKLDIQTIQIDVPGKQMLIKYRELDAQDMATGGGIVRLIDDPQANPATTEFTDFYDTWTTHQQLYDKVAEKISYTGTYVDDENLA